MRYGFRLPLVVAALACAAFGGCGEKAKSPTDTAGTAEPRTDAGSGSTTSPPEDAGSTTHDDGGAPASPVNVLFIGNSYTAVNDLPSVFASIATSSKVPPEITAQAYDPGGATLQDQYTGGAARPLIAKGGWTHVVLQGQSVEPAGQPAVFEQYAKLLATDVDAVHAIPTFYETWARREGDAVYQETWSGGSPAAFQDILLAEYTKASKSVPDGTIAKVGEAWRATLAGRPALVLHQSDGSHPTMAGTLLAAYVLYMRITGREVPTSSVPPTGVSADDAAYLRTIAASVQ